MQTSKAQTELPEPIVVLIDYGATRWRREADNSITLLRKDGAVLGYW